MSKKDDTGLNWDQTLTAKEKIMLHGIPELGISPEELQAGYNDRQEEAGRMA